MYRKNKTHTKKKKRWEDLSLKLYVIFSFLCFIATEAVKHTNIQKLNLISGIVLLFCSYLWGKKKQRNKRQKKKGKVSFRCVIPTSVCLGCYSFATLLLRESLPSIQILPRTTDVLSRSSGIVLKKQYAKDDRFPSTARNSVLRKKLNT